jgi:hypothetical protein
MNLLDLTIIYLTCGAPFGVYYFYQQRNVSNLWQRWLNSLLVTLFWFVYAIKLSHSLVTKKLLNYEFDEKKLADSKIDEIEKKFSQLMLDERTGFSLFEFREVFERYVGLSKAIEIEAVDAEAELYQISNHENKKLATKLLNRRNRSRLVAHHTFARRDFLRAIEKIASNFSQKEKIRNLATDFVKLINDAEAEAELSQIFQKYSQFAPVFPVKQMENDVWKPIETKLSPTPPKPLSFPTLSVTATTSKTD